MTFAERIGGVLVRPFPTFSYLAVAKEGGLADVALLLGLRVLAGEAPTLARGALAVPALGPGAALQGLIHAVGAVVPDVLGILIGSVLMGLFAGRGSRRARELDLAAYAWIPYLAVTLAAALVDTALQRRPGRVEELAVTALALAASAAVWTVGLVVLRRTPPAEAA